MTMLTCKDASRLISERQERSLRTGELWALRLHLWLCASCRRFARQLGLLRRVLRTLARRMATDVDGPELAPEARERIRKVLAERAAGTF
jgi:hypothetical protein